MKLLVASMVILALAGSSLYAEEKAETIKGTVICLGCSLKKGEGAKAQCSVYGHKNAVKTDEGTILTILENDQSTKLINNHDLAGKNVDIKGRRFPNANVIQVDSFTIKPE